MAGGTFWLQADASDNGKGTGSLVSHCQHGPGTDAQPLHPRHMTSHLPGGSWVGFRLLQGGPGKGPLRTLYHLLPRDSGRSVRLNPRVLLTSWVTCANCAVKTFLYVSGHHPAATQEKAEGDSEVCRAFPAYGLDDQPTRPAERPRGLSGLPSPCQVVSRTTLSLNVI